MNEQLHAVIVLRLTECFNSMAWQMFQAALAPLPHGGIAIHFNIVAIPPCSMGGLTNATVTCCARMSSVEIR